MHPATKSISKPIRRHFLHHMNPLLVTWSPLRYTEIGRQNFDALSDSGFTAIRCTPAGDVHRRLARLCLEEFGDAFHIFVLGQVYFPIHMAIRFGINLVYINAKKNINN